MNLPPTARNVLTHGTRKALLNPRRSGWWKAAAIATARSKVSGDGLEIGVREEGIEGQK
jgi:hypothetical protein